MEYGARFLAVAGLALFAGCAGNEGPAGLQVGEMSMSEPGIQLVIENSTPSSVRAYALAHGDEITLGRVTALGSKTVRLPESIGTFRLMVRPSALDAPGRQHVSEMIQVLPGQQVTWELQPSPGTSQLPRMSVVQVFACQSADC